MDQCYLLCQKCVDLAKVLCQPNNSITIPWDLYFVSSDKNRWNSHSLITTKSSSINDNIYFITPLTKVQLMCFNQMSPKFCFTSNNFLNTTITHIHNNFWTFLSNGNIRDSKICIDHIANNCLHKKTCKATHSFCFR